MWYPFIIVASIFFSIVGIVLICGITQMVLEDRYTAKIKSYRGGNGCSLESVPKHHPMELLPKDEWLRDKVLKHYLKTGILIYVTESFKLYLLVPPSGYIYLCDIDRMKVKAIKKKIVEIAG